MLDCIQVPITQPVLDAFSNHGHKPSGTPVWSYPKTGKRNAKPEF